MSQDSIDTIIQEVADARGVSPQKIRDEMEQAIALAQSIPDPEIQRLWASIPKRGKTPTLEEFIQFMANQVNSSL